MVDVEELELPQKYDVDVTIGTEDDESVVVELLIDTVNVVVPVSVVLVDVGVEKLEVLLSGVVCV